MTTNFFYHLFENHCKQVTHTYTLDFFFFFYHLFENHCKQVTHTCTLHF